MTAWAAFAAEVLALEGVTYLGPEHQRTVGVETTAHRVFYREVFDPSVAVVVTGPLVVTVKVLAVVRYEQVMKETKPW